jgi:hypothetical protein
VLSVAFWASRLADYRVLPHDRQRESRLSSYVCLITVLHDRRRIHQLTQYVVSGLLLILLPDDPTLDTRSLKFLAKHMKLLVIPRRVA